MTLGIEDFTQHKPAISPNPNKGNIKLDFGLMNGNIRWQIYDTQGKVIEEERIMIGVNHVKEIKLNVAPGIYYLKIISDKQQFVEKIVVQ